MVCALLMDLTAEAITHDTEKKQGRILAIIRKDCVRWVSLVPWYCEERVTDHVQINEHRQATKKHAQELWVQSLPFLPFCLSPQGPVRPEWRGGSDNTVLTAS